MARVYFAEFTDTETGNIFQKIGHTGEADAATRLNRIVEPYPKFTARVLASAFHFDIEKCQGAEMAFHAMYPKNFWLDEKISGITECVKLDRAERNKLIKAFRKLNEKFKHECFGKAA